MIRIHDLATDEIIDREMTDAEYEVHLEEIAKREAEQAEKDAKAAAKAELLAKLGITAEEAALLLA